MPARNETLLYATQVRLTRVQRDYLAWVCQAEDIAMSAAIRECIDQVIDALPPLEGATVQRGGSGPHEAMMVRDLLERSETDPEQLAEILARASLHEPDAVA